ncbi:CRISPR system precrRNA processing endoribonuclease RAMP protein Cas6 [Plantactinospora sp. B5E13]|uniref:CRISPR system precrRNA processing endoribonuclease RAMP protein Cas6 n=1 Tax=Plantactinospora sp. B5E13 TaxID=3153758 RepID=UPI00325EF94B
MPSRWRITTPGIDPTQVRVEHLHAVVSSWFDTTTNAHRAQAKPYTISPPARHTLDSPGFEVTLLDDTLTNRLLTRAAPGVRLRLGAQHTQLDAGAEQIATTPWTHLTAGDSGANAWCLRFVTPTTFRRGNSFTPWPAPNPVLGGLRAAWRRFAPPGLPELVLDLATDPVWVTDVDGANQVLRINNLTVSGFVGRIRYACDAPTDTRHAVDRLMRLAPYAGIGAHTTRGLGQVRPEPTWRQPDRP